MTETVIEFDSCTKTARTVCGWIGMVPYMMNPLKSKTYYLLKNLYFWSSFCVLALLVVGELIYLIQGIGNYTNFLEMTALAPCIGLCFMGLAKSATIWGNRSKITNIVRELKEIFPKTKNEQIKWNVKNYLSETKTLILVFVTAYVSAVAAFNFVPFIKSLNVFIRDGFYPKEFPYFIWYPYDPYAEGWFGLNYVIQMWAGFTATFGSVGPDVLFCSIVAQICLQFDILSKKLLNYVPQNSIKDYQFLNECVRQHNLLIEFTAEVELIFSSSMLLNFISSCGLICVLGFQASADLSAEDLFKFILFLIAALLQIYTMCFSGQKIIESSSKIGDSIFQQNWNNADVQYKKYLIIVIRRSQQVSKFTAKKFSVVSIESFMTILSSSYKFYNILRIFYLRIKKVP